MLTTFLSTFNHIPTARTAIPEACRRTLDTVKHRMSVLPSTTINVWNREVFRKASAITL